MSEIESQPSCHNCGSTEIDRDPSRGDAVCTNCGSVLEESIIVSEVQFSQDSHGASHAVGQLVTADGNAACGLNLGHTYGFSKESRMVTLFNAKKKITDLARKLVLSDHCIDMAHNFYKMALAKRLTQGRKNTHIIAACIYLVCRQQETPHMLLDISDILQVNVYELGKTYQKLQSELCINTPTIDPSLYILRFAHQLGFGNKVQEVAVTASRLVQRMKRDWINTGRRPSGLCGAALLVAARMHNFNRTVNDVIKVVKIGQATVRKRLFEFIDTPSSRLTLDEFMTIDLEEEQDPPAFKAARKKKNAELEDNKMKELEFEVSVLQKQIEKELEKLTQKKNSKVVSMFKIPHIDGVAEYNSGVEQFITENTFEAISELLAQEADKSEVKIPSNSDKEETSSLCSIDFEEYFKQPSASNNDSNDCCKNNELDLTGLNDDEIDSYILSTSEIRSKSKFWFDMNRDYLVEQKLKEAKRLREEEDNAKKEPKKKRQRQKRGPLQAHTTGEVLEKIMQQKKISLKLDYNVLKSLNAEKSTEEAVATTENKEESPSNKEKRVRRRTPKPKPQPVIPTSIRNGISDLVMKEQSKQKSKYLDNEESSTSGFDSLETETSRSSYDAVLETTNEIEETNYNSQDEQEDEDEDDEIDHSQLSAAQLLGYNNQEIDDYISE